MGLIREYKAFWNVYTYDSLFPLRHNHTNGDCLDDQSAEKETTCHRPSQRLAHI